MLIDSSFPTIRLWNDHPNTVLKHSTEVHYCYLFKSNGILQAGACKGYLEVEGTYAALSAKTSQSCHIKLVYNMKLWN